MNEQKLKRFMADKDMADSVYASLLHSFLRKRSNSDVNLKAAQMVAVELLEEAWKELERFKGIDKEKRILTQVGL